MPIGTYTGTPQISVPIYTIEDNNLQIPISLSYNASGIRVAEEASWTGLGWALNTGGVISRTIRGVNDFEITVKTGFIRSRQIPVTGLNDIDSVFYDDPNWPSIMGAAVLGYYDPEPDMFYFSFLGNSGKFFFKNCYGCPPKTIEKPVFDQQGDDHLDIEYHRNTDKWEVTDVMGVKYIFGTKEITDTNTISSATYLPDDATVGMSLDPVTSSWYLDKIILLNGEEINFEYDVVTANNISLYRSKSQLRKSQSSTRSVSPRPIVYCYTECGAPDANCQNPSLIINNHTASSTVTDHIYLKKITFSNGYMEFLKSQRLDLDPVLNPGYLPPQKLDEILIYNSNDDLIKKYKLYQSYFKRNPTDTDTRFLRLRLDSIQEISPEGGAIPPYKFAYIDNISIPKKTSRNIDHWGYYNGKNNETIPDWGRNGNTNGTLIPNYFDGLGNSFLGANREPDIDYAKIFTLYQIEFPTGGIHTYEYEANEFFSLSPPTTVVQNKSLFDPIYACTLGPDFCDYNDPEVILDFEVTTEMIQNSPFSNEIEVSFTFDGIANPVDCNDGMILPGSFLGMVWLNEIDGPGSAAGQIRLNILYPDPSDAVYGCEGGVSGEYYYSSNRDDRYHNLDKVKLQAGWYRLKVRSEMAGLEIYADATYKANVSIPNNPNQKGGGLRVKRTEMNPGANSIIKTYEYTKTNNPAETSGLIMSKPSYFVVPPSINNKKVFGVNSYGHIYCSIGGYVNASSDSYRLLSSAAQGSYIGYSSVKETMEPDGGYIIYEFENNVDQYTGPQELPQMPLISHPGNGSLRHKKYYNNGNTIVRSEYNSYDYDEGESIYHVGVKFYAVPLEGGGVLPIFSSYQVRSSGYWRLASTGITVYDEGGSPTITKATSYEHNTSNRQIAQVTRHNSHGKNHITSYLYPTDFPQGNPQYGSDLLLTNKMKGQVLYETRNYNGSSIFSKENHYNTQENHIVPGRIVEKSKPSSTPIVHDIVYDSKSNPIEVTREHAPTTSYFWGYNKQYLIAKIENASYQDIVDVLPGVNSITTLKNFDESNLTQLDQLRDLLPEATMVTTYTYHPLVGVASMTDPGGYTTHYHYDEFKRLKEVRDRDNNLVYSYEYHYAGQTK